MASLKGFGKVPHQTIIQKATVGHPHNVGDFHLVDVPWSVPHLMRNANHMLGSAGSGGAKKTAQANIRKGWVRFGMHSHVQLDIKYLNLNLYCAA